MAFTPKDWVSEANPLGPPANPATATKLSGAALKDLETRVTDYTDDSLAVLKEAPLNVNYPEYGGNINAALAVAESAAGGAVYTPAGSYGPLASGLEIGDDTALFGDGAATRVLIGGPAHESGSLTGIANADQSGGNSGITIRDLSLVGPENGTLSGTPSAGGVLGYGISLNKVTRFSIHDVYLERFNLQGIAVTECARGKIRDNDVEAIYSGNGISVDANSDRIKIVNNDLTDIADCAIGTHNGSTATVIEGNTIRNTNFGRGIDVYGAPDTTVADNTIHDVGGVGSAGNGIQVYVGLGATIPHRVQIDNNKIYGPSGAGIFIFSTGATTLEPSVTNNKISSAGDSGVYIARAVRQALIEGNAVVACAVDGIKAEHISTEVPLEIAILGNFCRGNGGYGIKATASVTGAALGNYLPNNTSGAKSLPGGVTDTANA